MKSLGIIDDTAVPEEPATSTEPTSTSTVETLSPEAETSTISTESATSSADLLVLDIASSSSDYFLGQYAKYISGPDLLRFNPYYMNRASSNEKQYTATHELGHALGLFHSYLGNIMNSYANGTTTLGVQDKLDYDYCWVYHNCVP